jgi:hypothetical protein
MDPRVLAPTPHKRKAFSACNLDDDSDAVISADKENNSSKKTTRGPRNSAVRKPLPLKTLSRAEAATPRSALKSTKPTDRFAAKSVAFNFNHDTDSANSEEERTNEAESMKRAVSNKGVSYADEDNSDGASSSDSDSDEESFETTKAPPKKSVYDF